MNEKKYDKIHVNEIIESLQQFGWIDYSIFMFMLIVCLLIGIYFGFFEKKLKSNNNNNNNNNNGCDNTKNINYKNEMGESSNDNRRQSEALDYFIGGRQMKIIPIAMSLVASWVSGISILGSATEIYLFGTQYIFIIIIMAISALVISYVYLPVFHDLQLTSTYEYLELRFDKRLRLMGSVLFVIGTVMWSPIVMYVPALAFNQVSGVNIHIVTPIVCIVCIFYTCVGGIKAVVWTDVIQTVVMYASIFYIAIQGTLNVGGLGVVIQRNFDSGRLELPEFTLDPNLRHSVLSLTLGGSIYWIQSNAGNQSMIQRYLALPTLRHARYALLIFTVSVIIMISTCAYIGLLIYAHYYDCDPLSTKLARAKDQLLPLFAMNLFKGLPGLAGTFVAAVFSAALSSLSTSLNSISAVVLEDFVKPFISRPLSEKQTHYIMRAVVCIFGVICVSLVFVVEHLGTVLQLSMSLTGTYTGALFGVFAIGVFLPWINGNSVLTGGISGIIFMVYICLNAQADIAKGALTFQQKPLTTVGCTYLFDSPFNSTSNNSIIEELNYNNDNENESGAPLHHVSYLLYASLGCFITFIVSCISTLFFGTLNPSDMDPKLFAPFIRRFIKPRKSFKDIKEMQCMIHELEVKNNNNNK